MANKALYQDKLTRIEKAIQLQPVDRIPVVYQGPCLPCPFSPTNPSENSASIRTLPSMSPLRLWTNSETLTGSMHTRAESFQPC